MDESPCWGIAIQLDTAAVCPIVFCMAPSTFNQRMWSRRGPTGLATKQILASVWLALTTYQPPYSGCAQDRVCMYIYV